MSDETKEKIRNTLKGRKRPQEVIEKMKKPKTRTPELLAYWESKRGKSNGKRSEETKKKMSEIAKERNMRPEYNRMLRERVGDKAPFWRGGKSKDVNYLREYREKRRYGFTRDFLFDFFGNKCIDCGISNEEHIEKQKTKLAIHHKDGIGRNSKNPNNNIENLVLLCTSCHAKRHNSLKEINDTRRIRKNGSSH